MTPQEAEELMNPFYPHDPSLAIRALSRGMREEAMTPEWVLESIVNQYFQYLAMQRLVEKQEEMKQQWQASDPFGLNTVPYQLGFDVLFKPWKN